jgi:hypothetical protein
MDINGEILAKIRQTLNRGGEIRLLNVYKGIPISYPGTILEIGPATMLVKMEKIQLACLYREKETFLQSHHFTETIKAKASELDLVRVAATLFAFEYVLERLGDRMQVRVEPNESVRGQIEIGDERIVIFGELADISQGGLAINYNLEQDIPRLFKDGTKVIVTIHLPGSFNLNERTPGIPPANIIDPISRFDRANIRISNFPTNIQENLSSQVEERKVHTPRLQIRGAIAYTNRQSENDSCRMGIRILPDDPARKVISQFITQRQNEIIREIKAISNLLSRPGKEKL